MSRPKPSPRAVSSVTRTSASALPKRNSMPPVSRVVMAPISNSSMAAAMVPPREMGSMPSSLHRKPQ
ncbi:hypothetical protein D3C83_217860 [compost metagenome]